MKLIYGSAAPKPFNTGVSETHETCLRYIFAEQRFQHVFMNVTSVHGRGYTDVKTNFPFTLDNPMVRSKS